MISFPVESNLILILPNKRSILSSLTRPELHCTDATMTVDQMSWYFLPEKVLQLQISGTALTLKQILLAFVLKKIEF